MFHLFLLELETVKSGQNSRSEIAQINVLARVCPPAFSPDPLLRLGFDQKKLFQSASSKMYGIILVRILQEFITLS